MFETFLDVVDKFSKDHNLVLCGVMLLVAVFVASFFLKTFWGQWADRAKEDQIYGKPEDRHGVSRKYKQNKTSARRRK